jgi:beta-galactosidase/beta-glucuronidase
MSDPSAADPNDYPRPQLRRREWKSLNGRWEFAIDPNGSMTDPDRVTFDREIIVPYSPETPASGVHDTGYYKTVWYRRTFNLARRPGLRLLLHFGAVDYEATVWFNGDLVMTHEGGYTPFFADVTDSLAPRQSQTIVVAAWDDPHDLSKPRGKQDWQLEPHSIWYPRTTGIWQTVWLEWVPETRLTRLSWTSSLERWEIGLEATIEGPQADELALEVRLQAGSTVLAADRYAVIRGEVNRRIALSDPGIDDYRNELLWTPSTPTLIQAQLKLVDSTGAVVDSIASYTALRAISIQGDRVLLNGRPYPLRMILDQGYWPETGMTAPSNLALRFDVELAKTMGFNGVRKHQKIEDPRYLFWADTLGLLIWEEMPSAYRFTRRSVNRLTREWIAAVKRDFSHPCIMAWVPFNESWGVPDLPDSPAQRHYVQSLYHLTKTLDPTRPVIGNDGWESVATDIIGIHDYDHDPERIAGRYGTEEHLPRLFKRERPGGRLLLIGPQGQSDQPLMLTEFGGIAFLPGEARAWGYSKVETAEVLAERYSRLLGAVRSLSLLSGFCYTQFTDTFQEANGLLYADRRPKFPLEQIASATRGPDAREQPVEWEWRERMMEAQRLQYLVPSEDYKTHENR